jgi:hypothetical protein
VLTAQKASGLVAAGGAIAVALLVASVVAAWGDGVVTAAIVLLLTYVLSLLVGERPLDRAAPLVAVALFLVIELATWSIELHDGPEERALRRIGEVALLAVAAAAASAFVLVIGSVRPGSSFLFVVVAAAAAFALAALIATAPPSE